MIAMSEFRALVITFTVMLLAIAGAFVALTLIHASSGALAATVIVLSCLGAHAISQVVMHYGAVDQRRKREETLLLR
jgi:multisubunit Na+/H+ antiporter MnhG subunit